MNLRKLLWQLQSSPTNVRFGDFQRLIEGFGFALDRVSGSHHVYTREQVPEVVNVQNVKGQAKPYQIRQFLKLVERHNLALRLMEEKDDENGQPT